MYNLILLILFTQTVLSPNKVSAGYRECNTVEKCSLNNICQCTISPSSAFNRYYYSEFRNIKKENNYYCEFTSSPVALTIVPLQSTFPKGSTYQYVPTSGILPLIFTLDTKHMLTTSGLMKIKFFVPASDYPTHWTFYCKNKEINYDE